MSIHLQVIDYFDALINQVDIKAEKLLKLLYDNIQVAVENRPTIEAIINERRRSFIDEIESIKQFNVSNLNDDDASAFKKYAFILDKYDMNISQYENLNTTQANFNPIVNEFIKEIDQKFGLLVQIDDGCPCDASMSMFKELLSYGNQICEDPEDDDHTRSKFYRQCENYLLSHSQIFTNNSVFDITNKITISFAILRKAETFIVRTNKRELFQVEEIKINECDTLTSLNPEAVRLFFSDIPLSIEIKKRVAERDDVKRLVEFCKCFRDLQAYFSLSVINSIDVEMSDLAEVGTLRELMFAINSDSLESSHLRGPADLESLQLYTDNFNLSRRSMGADAFVNLTRLTDLNLSFNCLLTVDASAFRHLTSLKTLDLSENYLESLEPFEGLASLAELNLFFNRIKHVHPDAFRNLVGLKILTLSLQDMPSIGESLFRPLGQLEKLAIRYSSIKIIHPEAFSTLTGLRYLELLGEYTEPINPKWFENKPNLAVAKIVPYFDFQMHIFDKTEIFQNVIELELKHLNLSHVDAESFVGSMWSRLKKFNFSLNQIDELGKRAFERLTSLEEFLFDFNKIERFDVKAFDGLSARLNRLSLMNNKFDHLFEGSITLPSLSSLDLSYNSLAIVPSDSFAHFPNLANLKLENNKSQRLDISPGAFSRLNNLTHLDLSSNQIERLEEFTFRDLANLRDLILNNNLLSRIEAGTFHGLRSLKRLLLGQNHIKQIEPGSFRTLANCVDVFLMDNMIDLLQAGIFLGLCKCRELSLVMNNIRKLDQGTFEGLPLLENLNLASNALETLDPNVFEPLVNLKYLNLSNNSTSNLRPFPKTLSRLKTLDLHYNELDTIEPGTFAALPNLYELNLSLNMLVRLSTTDFENLRNLQCLNVESNKLKQIDFKVFQPLSSLRLLYLEWCFLDNEQGNCVNLSVLDGMKNLTVKSFRSKDNYSQD